MRTPAVLLRTALRVLKALVVAKPTLPVLGHIKVEARNNLLTVEGTDLDTRASFTIPATGDLAPVLLPFKRFAALLGAAGSALGEVTLDVQGKRVVVGTCGRSFQLEASIPVEEYPAPIPEPKGAKGVVYSDPEDLGAALGWLLPAVSSDPTRPMLGGLSFDLERIAGCDGHRLHVVHGMPKLDGKGLLPAPAARTLLSFLKVCAPWTVNGQLGDDKFAFKGTCEDMTFSMVSKAIEGTFPDIDEVIPKTDATAASVPVSELDAALALAAKVAGKGYARLLLNGALIIEASDLDDGGTTTERVEAVRIHGDAEVTVGADISYLRDAVAVDAVTAVVGMTDAMSPITVRFQDDDRRLAVIMPMRL